MSASIVNHGGHYPASRLNLIEINAFINKYDYHLLTVFTFLHKKEDTDIRFPPPFSLLVH